MEEGEIAAWRERLAENGVPLEAEVRWPNGGHSLYFRDPAGNSVELVTPRTWGLHDAR
jgi:catechol 2,3-dioxygenase-like lactoylglutathione lyase family enzyme